MTSLIKINGFAAEATLQRLAAAAGCKTVQFETQQLVTIARTSGLGWHRLKLALPYLISEYGRRSNQGKYRVEWDSVPPTVILDYVYGIDAVFLWRGWCIGIDATSSARAALDKQAKIQAAALKPLWQAIGIDFMAVAYVQSTHTSTDKFIQNLHRVIKNGETFIEL
jgi:hypothetical protein